MRFSDHVYQSPIRLADDRHAFNHDAAFDAASLDHHRKVDHVVICRINPVYRSGNSLSATPRPSLKSRPSCCLAGSIIEVRNLRR
jgi:hypothetical protein